MSDQISQAARAHRRGARAKPKLAPPPHPPHRPLEQVLLNATRDIAHAQLAMHAKGLEHFTALMSALPRV